VVVVVAVSVVIEVVVDVPIEKNKYSIKNLQNQYYRKVIVEMYLYLLVDSVMLAFVDFGINSTSSTARSILNKRVTSKTISTHHSEHGRKKQ
jgi:hypothetical protein